MHRFLSLAACTALLTGCATDLTSPLARIGEPTSFIELRSEGNQIQSHQYSCGAASLATLMTSLGEPITEQEILELLLPNKKQELKEGNIEVEPLSVKDLEDMARLRGLKAASLQVTDEKSAYETLSELAPVITRMNIYNEVLHFVVVHSVNNGWVYIGDPGYGNIRIPWETFYKNFHQGESIFVAVSKKPFKGYLDKSTGSLALMRSDQFEPKEAADERPNQLYDATKSAIRFTNSL